ncbi:MAG: superoxide dismutase family protein [Thalassobaculum sp.]|uniref:superoxide dismutase family protein n=2 Tax=Thalassobaculum sp. TaxID=2022740 RepID=UPI0032EDDBCC
METEIAMRMTTKLLGSGIALLLSAASADAEASTASAQLKDADGRDVGTVELRETASGAVWLTVTGAGLPPGAHGFHIHETGSCDAASGFKSAGGHLAGEHQHGVLTRGGAHPGDLPNIHVGSGGNLKFEAFIAAGSSRKSWFQDVGLFDDDGSAVVIHADADDYMSQPSGNAGDRIACGVLKQ